MTQQIPPTQHGDLGVLCDSFELALVAEAKSPATVDRYTYGVRRFTAWLASTDGPAYAAHVGRNHVRDFMAAELAVNSPSTAATRFGDLRAFFKFLALEEDLPNPMEGMKAPEVPEKPVAVVTDEAIRKLLKSVDGRSFRDRRDAALFWLFADTPMRLGAVAGMTVGDVDLREMVAHVTEKGSKKLTIPFGPRTARALDRYLRSRAAHPRSDSPMLWIAQRGPMTASGIRQMVGDRAERVGLGRIHPHMFRHTFAHQWRKAGGSDSDLQELAGWESPAMLRRYGKSVAKERAVESHRRMRLSDRL